MTAVIRDNLGIRWVTFSEQESRCGRYRCPQGGCQQRWFASDIRFRLCSPTCSETRQRVSALLLSPKVLTPFAT
jgi:hypothetical protein